LFSGGRPAAVARTGSATFAPAASNSPFSNSNNTITCYGANNSSGDPACTSAKAYLRPAVAHNGRILQLGAKFIF